MLHWDGDQAPVLERREKALGLTRIMLRTCEVCERHCEESCPRLVEMTTYPPLGVVSARSATVMQSGDPNEIIKSILIAALSSDLIDGVIMLDLDPWSLEPVARIATSVRDIAAGVGMHYLWAPVLEKLNEAIFERGLEKLAVVGPPCVAQGARRLKEATNPRLWPYREAIRFTISRFCTGVYMPEIIAELLERKMGLSRHSIRDLQSSIAEKKLIVTTWDDEPRSMPLSKVERFTRHGCASCTDYLGESADIALGALGAEPDHSVLITRTPAGEAIIKNTLRLGLLECSDKVDREALAAAGADKDRRSRAKALDELHILMLESLGDPRKRAHVRDCFVRLFSSPQAKDNTRRKTDVSCGGC